MANRRCMHVFVNSLFIQLKTYLNNIKTLNFVKRSMRDWINKLHDLHCCVSDQSHLRRGLDQSDMY